MSVYEAKGIFRITSTGFSGVRRYMTEIVERRRRRATLKRSCTAAAISPELTASNFATRSFGERVALNMPIQGTAADVMKLDDGARA